MKKKVQAFLQILPRRHGQLLLRRQFSSTHILMSSVDYLAAQADFGFKSLIEGQLLTSFGCLVVTIAWNYFLVTKTRNISSTTWTLSEQVAVNHDLALTHSRRFFLGRTGARGIAVCLRPDQSWKFSRLLSSTVGPCGQHPPIQNSRIRPLTYTRSISCI